MTREARIAELIEPSLQSMGYDIVRIQISGTKRPTMQIMAERKDAVPMTVDDCADISRAVSAILDVEDPIEGAYNLEVSSPGIDRPLTREQDFVRFAGFEAKVETRLPVEGRKRFKGRLVGLTDQGEVELNGDDGHFRIPFAEVSRAKLVLTDDLIAAALKEQESQG